MMDELAKLLATTPSEVRVVNFDIGEWGVMADWNRGMPDERCRAAVRLRSDGTGFDEACVALVNARAANLAKKVDEDGR